MPPPFQLSTLPPLTPIPASCLFPLGPRSRSPTCVGTVHAWSHGRRQQAAISLLWMVEAARGAAWWCAAPEGVAEWRKWCERSCGSKRAVGCSRPRGCPHEKKRMWNEREREGEVAAKKLFGEDDDAQVEMALGLSLEPDPSLWWRMFVLGLPLEVRIWAWDEAQIQAWWWKAPMICLSTLRLAHTHFKVAHPVASTI